MSTFLYILAQPALVAWLLKSTALLILALGATTLLRRASAGTRHLVWLATLAGILLLPAVSLWAPLRLAILPAELLPSLPAVSTARLAPARASDVTLRLPATATPNVAPAAAAIPIRGAAAIGVNEVVPNEPVFPLWTTLFVIWGAVALILIAWLGFGALSVRRIVRTGRELDDRGWTAPLCEIADRLDLDAVPRLLSSPLIEMPFACGVLQPTIVLPASAEQWTDSRRRAVLFHELAHVRRRDLVGHTLGRVTCALYWFHPLVWTAARHLRAESERACDDLVLSCGARASDYADHLLDIVISVRRYGAPATAMPMARRRELEGRVLAILDPAVARIGPGRVQSVTLLAGLGALALSIAAVAPTRSSERNQPIAERQSPSLTRVTASGDSVTRAEAATRRYAITATSNRENTVNRQNALSPQSPRQDPQPPQTFAPRPSAAPTATPEPAPRASTSPVISGDSTSLSQALGTISRLAVRSAAAALSGGDSKGKKQGVDSAKIALLVKVLRSDPDASVRRMAAWGLNDAGEALGALDALVEAVRRDEDEGVREMAAWALADSRRETARRALSAALRRDPSAEVRETAVWALGNAGVRDEDREVIEIVLSSDESAEVRESAAWALGNSPRRPAARALITALGDRSAEVRESAAWALAEIGDEDVAPAVESAFERETSAEVRMAELRALTFMHVDSKSILDAALASKDANLRARAVRMLAGAGGAWPEPRPRPRPRPMP